MVSKDEFIHVVRGVDRLYNRVIWEPERIYEEFGRRNVSAITNSGEINFLCCLERNYLVASIASNMGIETRLVTVGIKRPFQLIRIGSAVEFDSDEGIFTYVAAITGDKIVREIYPSRKSHVSVRKVGMDKVDTGKSWFENFGVNSLDGLGEIVPGFDLDEYLYGIVVRNNPDSLSRVLKSISRKRESKPGIYI